MTLIHIARRRKLTSYIKLASFTGVVPLHDTLRCIFVIYQTVDSIQFWLNHKSYSRLLIWITIAFVCLKAKPHGCCIFSMILHEAPSMETTTPKGEWFPCWVAEWSIMENMQQQMWFCFYPSPISINISIYVYNALRLTPEIWFWAMPFASFQIDITIILLLSRRVARWYLIVTSFRHGSRDKTIVWWFLASLFFLENTCYKQRYEISKVTGYKKKHINGTHHSLSAPKTNLESPDMAWMPWTRALPSYGYAN